MTIAKFAKSIVPPRIVTSLPVLPSDDYTENSIVTYQGALYQNTGGIWKPMFDKKGIGDQIDTALEKYAENIPENVTALPPSYNGKNFVMFEGKLYTWNGVTYVISGINPELEKNIPKVVITIPTTFNGSNNLVKDGQMYSWNGVKYVPQYDSAVVNSIISQAINNLHQTVNADLPKKVSSIPATFNGFNNLILASNSAMYTWNTVQGKYLPQFDKVANEASINLVKTTLEKDVPLRVTKIPTSHSGYNNLVLVDDGQLYVWNGTKYVIQFSESVAQSVIDASTIKGTKIENGSIQTEKLATNSVTAVKIAANSVTAAKIAVNSITASHITAGAITATELATNSVTAAKIVTNAVTADAIAANAVVESTCQCNTSS